MDRTQRGHLFFLLNQCKMYEAYDFYASRNRHFSMICRCIDFLRRSRTSTSTLMLSNGSGGGTKKNYREDSREIHIPLIARGMVNVLNFNNVLQKCSQSSYGLEIL